MDNQISEYINLLRKYEKIPKPEVVLPTFMDIAGFPHYENVCSNILAFYFDTCKPHGFGDLLIRSLLDSLGFSISKNEQVEVKDVRREVVTASDKRIDIVIETNQHVICIENKIRAELYNDLGDYAKHIDSEYSKQDKHKIFLVLSLNKIGENSLTNGFVNLTHSDFIEKVKDNWGRHVLKAQTKYHIYLTDFFSTILKFTERMPMNSEMRQFLIENRQEVNSLINSWRELQNEVEQQVRHLATLVGDLPTNARQWIYGKHDLVHDFDMPDGVMIAVDCWVQIEGFRIRVWKRKGRVDEKSYLSKILLFNKEYTELANRYNIQEIDWNEGVVLPAGSSTEEIAEVLVTVLRDIRFANEISELSSFSGTQENNLLS